MRVLAMAGAALFTFSAASAAWAWDDPGLWYADAAGAQPGGGGLLGTGSARDRGITCKDCHTNPEGLIDLKIDFTPALPTVGGQPTYAPGQKYQVAVKLIGEHLGLSGCGQYLTHVNNFAASIEDAAGKPAGTLASDSGQNSQSCPPVVPKPINGTTVLYGDCHAITSSGVENTSAWSFSWTAPASGAGALTLYYGAVDGNCDMMSMNDDVKVGAIKLGEATALYHPREGARSPAPARLAALLALLPVGAVWMRRRRRRAG